MSFGYSVGDFVSLAKLAWTAYISCKNAPNRFDEIAAEVLSLHVVLKQMKEVLRNQPASQTTKHDLEVIEQGCRGILSDLQAKVNEYESLGTSSKRVWDRMKFAYEDIATLRSRLISNTLLLDTFISNSQFVAQAHLVKLVREIKAGKREGSVVSTITVESLTTDAAEAWDQIRRDLEDVGLSIAAFDANKSFILGWFRNAIESGILQEEATPDTDYQDDSKQRSFLKSYETDLTDNVHASGPSRELSRQSPACKRRIRQPYRSRTVGLIIWLLRHERSFHYACAHGNRARAEELLEKGVDIDAFRDGQTPLTFAVSTGTDMMTWLLKNGADPSKGNSRGNTPLCLAIKKIRSDKDLDICTSLLESGADPNIGGRERALHLAIETIPDNRTLLLKFINILLRFGVNVNSKDRQNQTTIHILSQSKLKENLQVELMSLLKGHGADLDKEDDSNYTALSYAVKSKSRLVVEFLLENGAKSHPDNPSFNHNNEPLGFAVENNDIKILRILFHYGALPDTKVPIQRHWLPYLVDTKADQCALEFAARRGWDCMVRELLNNGASYNTTSSCGCHTLGIIMSLKRDSTASILLEGNKRIPPKLRWHRFLSFHPSRTAIDLESEGPFTQPPLHIATISLCLRSIDVLLQRGANINEHDDWGLTPLDYAVKQDDLTTAHYLLDRGAINNHQRWIALAYTPPQVAIVDFALEDTYIRRRCYVKVLRGYERLERERNRGFSSTVQQGLP